MSGPAGALTGAAVFGLSGYTWGHLIHTSMINALASVPFVIWGLECSWSSGRWRGAVLGGLALACQVFAGHLQDALFTVVLVGIYGLYRAATERGRKERVRALGMAGRPGRSWASWSRRCSGSRPRSCSTARHGAGGLSWDDLVFGVVASRAAADPGRPRGLRHPRRDTDWMDGFYPYHEMNAYMGLIAMALAVVGAGGPAERDRWANFWVVLIGLGAILMLGKFTFLYDRANRHPGAGQLARAGAVPLWVALGVAALAAVGVERLSRPGRGLAPRRADPRGRARRALHPDHDLHLRAGLDPAETVGRAVSPRPLSDGWAAS